MNQTVQRYQIADYLNVGEMKAETYELMGAGFNTLDENPAAQLDTKTYINDRSATSTIKGYQAQFPFDTDLIASEKENTFKARKFHVSIEVASFAGAGGETVKVTGNLNNVGSFVDGEFNTETKTFTPAGAGA